MKRGRTRLLLIGDSIVMSYGRESAPQAGWGEMLIRHLTDGEFRVRRSPDSKFSNAMLYEGELVSVDNRAMGGRSVKTFSWEGRTADALSSLSSGDWLLMQFGHNDANAEKTERYVKPEEFKERLLRGILEPAREKGAKPVLVTPLAMREYDEHGVCHASFPAYREAMLELAAREGVPLIDLGLLSAELNTRVGAEASKNLYLWLPAGTFPNWPGGSEDNAHLQMNGAYLFAGIVAEEWERIQELEELK